jgi:hypothetical protein
VWHGVILYDIDRLNYPREVYMIGASIVYLLIGLLVSWAYSLKFIQLLTKNPFLKGIISGGLCGFFIYLTCIIVGISFSKVMTMKYILVDVSWQMLEQAAGGIAVALVHFYIPDFYKAKD